MVLAFSLRRVSTDARRELGRPAFAHEAIAAERQGWDTVMWAWELFEKALIVIASV